MRKPHLHKFSVSHRLLDRLFLLDVHFGIPVDMGKGQCISLLGLQSSKDKFKCLLTDEVLLAFLNFFSRKSRVM